MQPSDSWVRLSALDNQTVTVSLDNRGLAYADGFFTTMGVIKGQILWADYHHQRLIFHGKALQLDLDSHALLAILKTYAVQLQQGMLKLIITRAAQAIRGYGYLPSECGSACEIWLKSSAMPVSTAEQLPMANDSFVPVQPMSAAVCLSSQIACLPPPLAGLKSLNRLDNVLASAELQGIKAQLSKQNVQIPNNQASNTQAPDIELTIAEGLLRDMTGHWVEGTMSNVFYQLSDSRLVESPSSEITDAVNIDKGRADKIHVNYLTQGQWYTPSMAQSGVAGVMRQVLIDELSTTENPVIIRSLQDEDLPHVSQLFFCNALRGIMPMTSLMLLSGEVVGF